LLSSPQRPQSVAPSHPGKKAVLFNGGCQEAVWSALNSRKINRHTSGETVDRAPEPSRRKLALQLWDPAVPIAGTAAERYLRSRAIDLTGLARFAPRCIVGPPDAREEHPALLAVRGRRGIIAVQRILLDPATGEKRYHAARGEIDARPGPTRRHADRRCSARGRLREAVSVTQLSDGKFKVWGGIRRYGLIAIPERIRKIVIYSQPAGSRTGHRGRARPPHCQRPRTENHPPASPGADGLERHSSGESQVLIRVSKMAAKSAIALPILSVFAFGALFNQMQARNSEPVSIHVENPRIIDGDTLETLDKSERGGWN
jgi:hypothetical protein